MRNEDEAEFVLLLIKYIKLISHNLIETVKGIWRRTQGDQMGRFVAKTATK